MSDLWCWVASCRRGQAAETHWGREMDVGARDAGASRFGGGACPLREGRTIPGPVLVHRPRAHDSARGPASRRLLRAHRNTRADQPPHQVTAPPWRRIRCSWPLSMPRHQDCLLTHSVRSPSTPCYPAKPPHWQPTLHLGLFMPPITCQQPECTCYGYRLVVCKGHQSSCDACKVARRSCSCFFLLEALVQQSWHRTSQAAQNGSLGVPSRLSCSVTQHPCLATDAFVQSTTFVFSQRGRAASAGAPTGRVKRPAHRVCDTAMRRSTARPCSAWWRPWRPTRTSTSRRATCTSARWASRPWAPPPRCGPAPRLLHDWCLAWSWSGRMYSDMSRCLTMVKPHVAWHYWRVPVGASTAFWNVAVFSTLQWRSLKWCFRLRRWYPMRLWTYRGAWSGWQEHHLEWMLKAWDLIYMCMECLRRRWGIGQTQSCTGCRRRRRPSPEPSATMSTTWTSFHLAQTWLSPCWHIQVRAPLLVPHKQPGFGPFLFMCQCDAPICGLQFLQCASSCMWLQILLCRAGCPHDFCNRVPQSGDMHFCINSEWRFHQGKQ